MIHPQAEPLVADDTTTIDVEQCRGCPFGSWTTRLRFMCVHPAAEDDAAANAAGFRANGALTDAPPMWCPLRVRATIVRLK